MTSINGFGPFEKEPSPGDGKSHTRCGVSRMAAFVSASETATGPLEDARPSIAVTADLEPDFLRMVDRSIGAILSGDARPDMVFGDYSGLVSMARSVSFHEGRLLEWGMIRIAACNRDLQVMPPDKPMPVVPAAIEFLERNEWSSLEGIRLRSEVHAKQSYTPDIVIVNRKRHSALIIDVKRSLASYAEHRLDALRNRMMAVALIAADWLYVERKAPLVSDVGIAIIDGSNEASDHGKGVFGLSEIDDLFEIAGAGEAMAHLRTMFAVRVREELGRRCKDVLSQIDPAYRDVHHDAVRGWPEPDDPDDVPAQGATSTIADKCRGQHPPRIDARVRVGFARSRASP